MASDAQIVWPDKNFLDNFLFNWILYNQALFLIRLLTSSFSLVYRTPTSYSRNKSSLVTTKLKSKTNLRRARLGTLCRVFNLGTKTPDSNPDWVIMSTSDRKIFNRSADFCVEALMGISSLTGKLGKYAGVRSIYLPFSDDFGNLNIYKTETSSFNCSANNMSIMFPSAKRSLQESWTSCFLVVGLWPSFYWLFEEFGALIVRRHIYWDFFSFRLLLSLLDLLFTSLLLTIGYLPINGYTVLVEICIAGLLSVLDFENHKGGLSFFIIVITRADCIHLIVMRWINKVIIRLAVPHLSSYYNFVSSKFARKNTIYYFQVAYVICSEIRGKSIQ